MPIPFANGPTHWRVRPLGRAAKTQTFAQQLAAALREPPIGGQRLSDDLDGKFGGAEGATVNAVARQPRQHIPRGKTSVTSS